MHEGHATYVGPEKQKSAQKYRMVDYGSNEVLKTYACCFFKTFTLHAKLKTRLIEAGSESDEFFFTHL